MFDLINGLLRFMSDLLETNPYQHGAANMVSDNSCFATLATFNSGQLLGFTVKLLDLPAKAAHILYDLHVVLRHLVVNDIVRALGRQHYSENFHLVLGRKALDFDGLAALLLDFTPCQAVHSTIVLCAARIIHLAIVLEQTVVDFAEFFNLQHDFFGRIPGIHEHSPERQLLLVDTVEQHVPEMVQFRLAIACWVVDAVVNDPKLISHRVDVHTSHHPDPFDDSVCIATVLPAHQLNVV